MIIFLLMLAALGIACYVQQEQIAQLKGTVASQNVWLEADQQLIALQQQDIFNLRNTIVKLQETNHEMASSDAGPTARIIQDAWAVS